MLNVRVVAVYAHVNDEFMLPSKNAIKANQPKVALEREQDGTVFF